MRRVAKLPLLAAAGILAVVVLPFGTLASGNVRLSNDNRPGGYVSEYTIATGIPVTNDPVINECSISRGRQNEPSVAVDPRNPNLLIGSSNDYCGVYQPVSGSQFPAPTGPIWLGYYRSQDGGLSFQSSLVPGYPGDTSPYAALAHVRTASAGDPVVTWDAHGRVFMGSESSGDPALSKKTFGDVWVAHFDNPQGETGATINDGKRFLGSETVAHGSSAPNLLGVFHDKTAIQADRTGGACDGNVYFAWARFNGNGNNAIYLSRSTDHGATWSPPMKVSASVLGVQTPEVSITGNGHVYVTFRQYATTSGQVDAVDYVKSVDCGRTFSPPVSVTTFTDYQAQDIPAAQPIPMPASSIDDPMGDDLDASGSTARDCGDFDLHCASGYTFFRTSVGTQVRSAADQYDRTHEWVYIMYDPTKPGTETPTGTTFGTIQSGLGSQQAVYFLRLDGATGAHTAPLLVADEANGHQLFPAISADGGVLHSLWWDSHNDPCYSPTRPVGNCADRTVVPSLDVYSSMSTDHGATWSSATRLTDVTSMPNYEQFSNREVPFAGDYLWVTSSASMSYGVWTDWRDTVAGTDQREGATDTYDSDGAADVVQCRVFSTSAQAWSGDHCPHAGGLDQNIYGSATP